MPLASIREEIYKAQAGGFAVPCFLAFDATSAEGIFAALAEKNCSGIIGFYSAILNSPSIEAFVAYLTTMARLSPIRASLMLDHGASVAHCEKALALGLTDIMYDGSKLPLEENIANTRRAVEAAHAAGAFLEAELGVVGSGRNYQDYGAQGRGFTDPAIAECFCAETKCDMLAVAIGNAHGLYQGEPRLDLELLAKIRGRVPVPLSLHGGTGLSVEQFRGAIQAGISKINIFTDLAENAAREVGRIFQTDKKSYFDVVKTIRETFRARCLHYIDVFRPMGDA